MNGYVYQTFCVGVSVILESRAIQHSEVGCYSAFLNSHIVPEVE